MYALLFLLLIVTLLSLALAAVLFHRLRRLRSLLRDQEKERQEHRQSTTVLLARIHTLEQSINLDLAPVFITDNADRIFFANTAFLNIAGLSVDQALGRPQTEVFTWKLAEEKRYCACIPQIARQQVVAIQYNTSRTDGKKQRTATMRSLPLFDTQERPCGKVHLLWDVTECLQLEKALRDSHGELEAKVLSRTESQAKANEELKSVIKQLESTLEERHAIQSALEESQKRLSLVLESANIGLWDWTLSSDVMFINEQWAHLTGHPQSELEPVTHETLAKLCHADDFAKAWNFFKSNEKQESLHFEQQVRLRHKEGHWVWVQIRGKVVARDEQENPVRVVGTAVDISKAMETKQLLLQSLYEFEAIFENSQVGVIYLKGDRSIARTNAKFCELTGYESWEILGESFEILHGNHERFLAFEEEHYARLLEEGIMHLEYELHRKDGKLLPCLLSGKTVTPSDPSKGIIWIVEDLIQLQQAKTQLNRQSALLLSLIDSIPDLLLYKDPDGVFLGCNKAFCNVTQRSREEIIGLTDYDLLPLESALRMREKDRQTLEARAPNLMDEELHISAKISKEFETLRTPYYGPDNELLGLIVTHRDIADRRRSEKLKKDVELMVRHDLKTPLNVVISLPQVLLKNPDLDQKERERYLRTINKSGLLMLDLINRSLDIYKMETGSYTLAPIPFDLIALISKVVEDCGLQAKNREVAIEFEKSSQTCTVLGEELLYYSMLANILKNAIEATPSEDIVRISLHCGESIRIECHNPGLVPESMMSTFFDKYATLKERGGSGLGTYSAKLIVELHQGTISMRSSESEGTTITILLPVHPQTGDPDKPRLY